MSVTIKEVEHFPLLRVGFNNRQPAVLLRKDFFPYWMEKLSQVNIPGYEAGLLYQELIHDVYDRAMTHKKLQAQVVFTKYGPMQIIALDKKHKRTNVNLSFVHGGWGMSGIMFQIVDKENGQYCYSYFGWERNLKLHFTLIDANIHHYIEHFMCEGSRIQVSHQGGYTYEFKFI